MALQIGVKKVLDYCEFVIEFDCKYFRDHLYGRNPVFLLRLKNGYKNIALKSAL